MPLARAPMLFVTVAQEKRDFKIYVILITELSQVRILHGPPNSANPNSFFFVKHCVGFVFIVEDVG